MLSNDFMNYDLRYDWGGKFTSREIWRHPTANNPTWEFVYMLRGEAHLFEETRTFCAEEGCAFLLAPHKTHGGTADSPGDVSFFWMHFYMPDMYENAIAALPPSAMIGSFSQIPLLFRQLLHFSTVSDYPKSVANALVGMLLTEYAIQTKKQTADREARLLSDICEWIRINADRRLTTEDVARQFQYHSDYLSRLFRTRLGISLKAYIDTRRMELLRNLLLTTDEPLKSIAARTGFDDYKAFLKYFTYHDTMTPTALRALYYKTHTNNY